jgi:hypothetical protein
MKRFQVARLFEDKNLSNAPGEWVDVKIKLPKERLCVVRVKKICGDHVRAYFCQDKCIGLHFGFSEDFSYSYFWDYEKERPLHDVTHWWQVLPQS